MKMIKRINLIIVTIVMVLTYVLPLYAYALDDTTVDFDTTYVLNDLQGSTIYGQPFNANDYPYTADGEIQILDFAEYCYSRYPHLEDRFGLYVYIYNPTGIEIRDSILNTIQLATAYGNDGEPTSWDKYTMKLCNNSMDKLFYKFKLENIDDIQERVMQDTEQRRYDISSVELFSIDLTTNARDYEVGGKWVYTGFGKGCDLTSEEGSTLQCTISPFQVLVLDDLQFTYYRSWLNLVGTGADQLTSVYFAVDNSIVNNYDNLYSIQAETYKYLTSPIFCITDGIFLQSQDNIYNRYYEQLGVDTTESTKQWGACWDMYYDNNYAYGYNCSKTSYNDVHTLAWLFKCSADTEYTVNSEQLLNYAVNYSASRDKSIRGKYSADLFTDVYYSFSNNILFNGGLLSIDITTDDTVNLVGSNRKADFWDYLTFGATFDRSEQEPLCPIVSVTHNDIKDLSDEDLSLLYRITDRDCQSFRDYVATQSNNNKTVYLFRFDKSFYYNEPIQHTNNGNTVGGVGYMAQEVAYLDFDIISLGWKKDGIISIMPVSSTPIDIFTAVEYGNQFLDIMWNLDQLMMLLALIILLIVMLYFPPVFKIVIWIITLPAKIIIWIFNLFKKLSHKRKKHKGVD